MAHSVDFASIKLEEIGRGDNAVVHKATWRNETIAVKKYIREEKHSEKWLDETYSELLTIDHNHLLKFYGLSEEAGKLVLLMEYSDCGSLHNRIHGEEYINNSYFKKDALNWMLQFADGLAFLHDMKPKPIIHGNLKPHNLFLTKNFQCLKIGELATEEINYSFKKDFDLIAYVAPEIRRHWIKNESVIIRDICTIDCDIYSYGIVLWEVISKRNPFYNKSLLEKWVMGLEEVVTNRVSTDYHPPLNAITNGEIFDYLKTLIEMCWNADPDKRPNIKSMALSLRILIRTVVGSIDIPVTLTEDEIDNVRLIQKVGQGSFGHVYKGTLHNVQYAIKKCTADDEECKKAIEREVKQLSRAIHKNIVRYYGTTEYDESEILIVMEYADCGTLYDFIHNKEKKENDSFTYHKLMLQLAQGVKYLHTMKPKPVIHRDLKTKNLLLSNNYQTLKIADFGTVTEQASLMSKSIGTPGYMAPEICKGEMYTEKSDVFSFGIILWEVMSRKKPFYHLGNREPWTLIYLVGQGEHPPLEDVNNCEKAEHLRNIIDICWNIDPEKRPLMEDIALDLSVYQSENEFCFPQKNKRSNSF